MEIVDVEAQARAVPDLVLVGWVAIVGIVTAVSIRIATRKQ